MTGNAIDLPSAQMLCDTEGCGHVELVGPRDVRKYVGSKCPKCDAVMVTEATALEIESMIAAIDKINEAIGPVESSGQGVNISARVDCAGDVVEASANWVKP